jgi:undecaprenyl-diphosphatase
MNIISAIILGVVEGFTEFLPISSTAHLVLTSRLLHTENSEFLKSFEISIQLGAIASVVFLYWKTLVSKWELNKKILTAFIPTAIVGLIFYGFIKSVLLENHLVSVYALLFGGIALIIFELLYKERDADMSEVANISYKQAFIIGAFQSIAIVPGVSRAAATIIGGLIMRIKRRAIVEFSFLLAVPTMAAATGLDLVKSAGSFAYSDFLYLATGFVVAFITAMISIKFLLKFIQNHNFTSFGIYRILLAVSFLFLL